MIAGATACSWQGHLHLALQRLKAYYRQEIRAYDGTAYECEGYCRWKLSAPYKKVDALYVKAQKAYGNKDELIARATIVRAQIELAHETIRRIVSNGDVFGTSRDTLVRIYLLVARLKPAEERGQWIDKARAEARSMGSIALLMEIEETEKELS